MNKKQRKKVEKIIKLAKKSDSSKGIAMLELSIIITAFLTLSFGTVSLGSSMHEISIASEATKHASRIAALEAFNNSYEYCETDHVATKGCLINTRDDLTPIKLFDTSSTACTYLNSSNTTSTKWDMTTYLEPLAVSLDELRNDGTTGPDNPNYQEGHGVRYDRNLDGRVDANETDLINRYVVRVVGVKEKNSNKSALSTLLSITGQYRLRTDSAYLTEASCS